MPAVTSFTPAAETYRCVPGPDLNCPVTALIGDSDPRVTLDEARSWAPAPTRTNGLKGYGGGHFYLDQHSQAVTRESSAELLHATTAPEGPAEPAAVRRSSRSS